tara:strand:+ start:62 stop:1882 length:1821 start_codon:yes stop_codon:yes gene_type:complete
MGVLTIKPARLVQRGRVIQQTEPITVQVLGADELSSDPPQITLRCEPKRATSESEIRATIEIRVGDMSQDLELGNKWSTGFQLVDDSDRRRTKTATGSDGKIVQVTTLSVALRPNRIGTYTLGPVPLISRGRVLAESNTVRVTIVPPPPVSAEDARQMSWYKGQKPAIRAYTDKDQYYVSEPFLIRWDLVEGRRGLSGRYGAGTEPSLEGFSAKPIDVKDERQRTFLGGKRVVTRPLQAKIARGFKPGARIIDSLTLKSMDPFTGEEVGRISSRPFKLLIKPLPKKDQPKGFEPSHVGQFEPTVEWPLREGDKLSTHQKVQLRVVIEGHGNLEGLVAPSLRNLGEHFSVEDFSDRGQDRIDIDEKGVHGHRIFRYRITPLKPGKHAFPSFRFDYFDPVLERYVSVEKKGPLVEITGSPVLDTAEGLGYAERDIGPILESSDFAHNEPGQFTDRPIFWLFLLIPLGLLLTSEAWHTAQRHRAKDPSARRSRTAQSRARKRLAAAEEAMKAGQAKEFFDEIALTLQNCLTERLSIPAQGLQHEELKRRAIDLGLTVELMENIVAELENCDFARFAASSSMQGTMEDTLRRAEGLVEGIGSAKLKRGPG